VSFAVRTPLMEVCEPIVGIVRNVEENGSGLIGMVPAKRPKTKGLILTEKEKARYRTVKIALNINPPPGKKR